MPTGAYHHRSLKDKGCWYLYKGVCEFAVVTMISTARHFLIWMSMVRPLYKWTSFRLSETPWRSCDITMITHNDPDHQERDNKPVVIFIHNQKWWQNLRHYVEQLILKIRGSIVPNKTPLPVVVEESKLNSKIVSERRRPFFPVIHCLIPHQYACSWIKR